MIRPSRLLTIGAAIGLVAGALLLSGRGVGSGGLTFRDITYGQANTCALTAKSNKVLLNKPKSGKGSVGTLTLYLKCNYHPTQCNSGSGSNLSMRPCTSAKLNGLITESFKQKQPNGRTYDDFKVGPIRRPLPKAGVRETFTVKLPRAALRGLRQGHHESASFQVNVPDQFSCTGAFCTGGRPTGLDIASLKGVTK